MRAMGVHRTVHRDAQSLVHNRIASFAPTTPKRSDSEKTTDNIGIDSVGGLVDAHNHGNFFIS